VTRYTLRELLGKLDELFVARTEGTNATPG
jgi:hypothetical protein